MASGSGAAQIPVSRPEDLKASPGHVPIEVRHRAARRLPGLALGQGFGDHPHAEFVVLQPCLEIRHQRVQQVVFRLVGMTEVGAPRHVAHDVDTGLPKRAGHDDSSSGLANPARPRRHGYTDYDNSRATRCNDERPCRNVGERASGAQHEPMGVIEPESADVLARRSDEHGAEGAREVRAAHRGHGGEHRACCSRRSGGRGRRRPDGAFLYGRPPMGRTLVWQEDCS